MATMNQTHICTTEKVRFRGAGRGLFWAVLDILAAWSFRYNSRLELSEMSDHQLKDIGLTRKEAHQESKKPFWLS